MYVYTLADNINKEQTRRKELNPFKPSHTYTNTALGHLHVSAQWTGMMGG